MGYSIIIGEHIPSDGEDLSWAQSVRLDEAPAFAEPTDHTNERWPSYSGWADFLEAVGLTYLSPRTGGYATDPDCPPLMEEHPGSMPVLPIHLERIEAAKEAYHKRIGLEKLPGWGEGQDPQLARLDWLVFWVRWALKNCKNPVCANS